ncbi:MAG: hypothetical protein K9L95_04005, partial [Candidatus Omnitrophica bacterium]|nr:hypothetical protein [Candidatus Omnitrophota bacterium]
SFFILTLSFLFSLTVYAEAQTITLKSLINNPGKYDGKMVSFEAEAIGDPLGGRKGIWFNVQSGKYNMGIFVKNKDLINQISHWGSYKERGDLIKSEGIFYKNCSVHGGRDLHLVSLEIVEKGGIRDLKAAEGKKRFALFSFVIFLTLGCIYLIKIRLWQQK